MLAAWRKERSRRLCAEQLYSSAAAQARAPALYLRFAIPDTLDGRFDALALHVALLVRALEAADGRAAALAVRVEEALVRDLDRTVRELGVGDMGVGKQVKLMMAAYRGRARAYGAALAASDEALVNALARNLYRGAPPARPVMDALARHVRAEAAHVGAQAATMVDGAGVDWLDVGPVP
ncbi:MAG: ubiquinol-cytochrome C chaperone family protein [Pseudomonadota bacterium]|jgi:cytochrome b pre-mRNA-processing protein 3